MSSTALAHREDRPPVRHAFQYVVAAV
ncbi:MAG: hypothetical protein QOG14_1762, partial [Mycobacterium sp.]|nr:hypothetical protein [Mycobacterium sp.]